MSRRLSAITATCTLVLAGTAVAGASPSYAAHTTAARYRVTDLGTLGGTFSFAGDVNDRGEVAGGSATVADTALHGFFWRNGVMTDLGTLGGPQSLTGGINSSGQVTGWSDLTTPVGPSLFNQGLFCAQPTESRPAVACHAFRWEHGKMTDLGTLGGQNSAAGNHGINASGRVVGVAETAAVDPTGFSGSLTFHAFLWQPGSRETGKHANMRDLGTLGSDPDSVASGVNDRDQVVGVSVPNASATNEENLHGFLWEHGKMTALGTLGGNTSVPQAINNRGEVVGKSSLRGNSVQHAAMWFRGRIVDLGTLPGDVFSEANVINDQGQILGTSCSSLTVCRAVRWTGLKATDLNTQISAGSGWQLSDAGGSNAGGQVAGVGLHNGSARAYLLTPVRNRTP